MIKIERLPNTDEILQAVKNNGGYCPCRINKTPDTRCVCKDFREQTEEGVCHCGLYYKTIVKD